MTITSVRPPPGRNLSFLPFASRVHARSQAGGLHLRPEASISVDEQGGWSCPCGQGLYERPSARPDPEMLEPSSQGPRTAGLLARGRF